MVNLTLLLAVGKLVLGKNRVFAGCGGGVRTLARLGDIPAQYTHPTTKQCNYSYTHPTTKQCNYSYTYTHPSTIQCNASSEISSLKSSVSNGKALVANAITGKGVATSSSDTFATMANNISAIYVGYNTSDASATAANIEAGYTAYTAAGKITGTKVSDNYLVFYGYYSNGAKTVTIPNLFPSGVRGNIKVFGFFMWYQSNGWGIFENAVYNNSGNLHGSNLTVTSIDDSNITFTIISTGGVSLTYENIYNLRMCILMEV